MRLKKAFHTLAEKNPYWSTYICLACAVLKTRCSNSEIRLAFNKLVDRKDYARKEKDKIVEYLLSVKMA